jgi:hypothetical protein
MKLMPLRILAILIAVLAIVDPAITTERAVRPEIAVIAADSNDAALAARLRRRLASRFTVLERAWPGAAATVIAGDRIPVQAAASSRPVIVVLPPDSALRMDRFDAPAYAPLDARVPVRARVRVHGARGAQLDVSLHASGLVVDRTSVAIDGESAVDVPLTFVPSSTGAVQLSVTAALGADSTSADIVVDVTEPRWAVLFFDPRASWMSTFVRRAIESDARFIVTSRTMTSRNVSIDSNRPPATLQSAAALDAYDVIVAGAPESLTDRDVDGLDAFLRRRGGSVVLLMDHGASGPYERLARVSRWSVAGQTDAMAIGFLDGDTAALRATGVLWPAALPAGAHPVATLTARAPRAPVLWRAPVGAGRLVVSGALDAWRFRDPSRSTFNDTWRRIIAESAESAVPAVDVALATSLLAPDERTDVVVTVRDAALDTRGNVEASVSAVLESGRGSVPVHLWPDGPVGRFRGVVRAPSTIGSARVVVRAGASTVERPLIVAGSSSGISRAEPVVAGAWAASRGGRAIEASQARNLADDLAGVLVIERRRTIAHPMRSPWWMVPFTLLLGLEWWLRRRRGLA